MQPECLLMRTTRRNFLWQAAATTATVCTLRVSQAAEPRPLQLLVVLIGGMNSDPTPEQVRGAAKRMEGSSGLYRLRGDLLQPHVVPEYFNWNGTRAGQMNLSPAPQAAGIAKTIREHCRRWAQDRVAIVGNSWGGHTAREVLEELHRDRQPVRVDLAVFLDGSSAGRGPLPAANIPENVTQTLNIYTRNSFVWGKLGDSPRLQNLDLGDPQNGFLRRKFPGYGDRFNIEAHIFAEWDERVHAHIRRRLYELLPLELRPVSAARSAGKNLTQ